MAEKEIDISLNKPQPKPQVNEDVINTDKIEQKKPLDLSKCRVHIDSPQDASGSDLVDLLMRKTSEDLLPFEKMQLPSLGQFYDGRIPGGWVEVRPMGLVVDKILATSRLTQSGQAIDHIYKSCVRLPDSSFDPLDLLTGDRTFLLFYLRGITHGNWYDFSITCTNDECKSLNSYEYDLNQLSSTIKYPKCSKEPVRITLPYLTEVFGREFWVEARLLRGRDIQNMNQKAKIMEKVSGGQVSDSKGKIIKKKDDLDQTIEQNLNLVITSVMGVPDRFKIQDVVSKLNQRDSSIIRETLRDVAPGIDTKITVKCTECGNSMDIDLPLSEHFFRSTDGGGVRG
jgi:hypothetical protein